MKRTNYAGCLVLLLIATLPATAASTKKGIGLSTYDGHWASEVAASKVSWVYTWGQDQPADLPNGVEFVPMVWSDHVADHLKLPKNAKEVLGFNEPDMPDQSHMTVDRAVEEWPILTQTGLPIGSPAPAWWSTKWMQQFMDVASTKPLRVDFVCIHWYNVPNPKFFLDTIDKIHDTYHKPIWITEFAVGVFQKDAPTFTAQQTEDFMRAVLPELEKRDYVQRYAWFPARIGSKHLGSSSLFNEDGSLTDLGKLYASF